MWMFEKIDEYLKNTLREKRYIHTKNVVKTAIELAKIHNISEEKARIGALAHDSAKNMSDEDLKEIIDKNNIKLTTYEIDAKQIWHAIVAPIVGKELFEIEDEEILSAMRWHTTGKEDMSKLDKIIYLADMIEPSRDFEGVDEIRKLAKSDLDLAMLSALTHTIKYLIERNQIIDINTIKARNYLIKNINS